jgi:hypothetical protein
MSIMPKWMNWLPHQWYASTLVLPIVILAYPSLRCGEAYELLLDRELSALDQFYAGWGTVIRMDENSEGQGPKDTMQDNEYRPAGGIKKFAEPTIQLRGTAEKIGLDRQSLSSFIGTKFLNEFAFLQSDFVFEKTYQTWEIGIFECETWTVGVNYPIAFHVQCAGGSMDEPREWHYASLGYGPADKTSETVRGTLDAIIQEYATFVRKASGKD